MQRSRDVSKFTDLGHHEFASFEEFDYDRTIRPGLTSTLMNDRWFDFLYEDRGSDVTMVTFTAALSPKADTYPRFSSRPIAEELGINFLGFADAAHGNKESLPTFWHLSTQRVDSYRIIPLLISELREQRPEQNFLFFGSSAGGFAALNYSALFPDSVVVVMNPRVNLLNAPKRFKEYAPVAHPDTDRTTVARSLPYNTAKTYEQPRGNQVVYLQNLQDKIYYQHHYLHFKKAVSGRNDVRFVTGNWGDGHVVPPRGLYMNILQSIGDSAPEWRLPDMVSTATS